jgi:TM2 domain-containing membrane protein YozV
MNKFCPSCGNALEEGQKFCGTCGKPAQGSPAAEAPVQGSNTGAVQPVQTGAPLAANVNTTHLLLCIFLGGFGAHCFAAGKKKRAITEMALFLLFLIILIFRMVRASSMDYAYNLAENWTNYDDMSRSVTFDIVAPLNKTDKRMYN